MTLISEIVLDSIQCRQAARNIWPEAPDELFNVVWLKIREKEIQNPDFIAKHPKYYFLRALKHQAIDWQRERQKPKTCIDNVKETRIDDPFETIQNKYLEYLDQWLKNEEDDFFKNILTLAIYCPTVEDVVELTDMSRATYMKYKKLAKNKFYDDFNNANIDELLGDSLL